MVVMLGNTHDFTRLVVLMSLAGLGANIALGVFAFDCIDLINRGRINFWRLWRCGATAIVRVKGLVPEFRCL